MDELFFNLLLITAIVTPPVLIGIWFFGLRKYIRKKGKTRITAASWGLSMWADWTVAWEIGRKEGRVPWSAKIFLLIQIIVIVEIICSFTLFN